MTFDDADVRSAYRRGAYDAFACMFVRLPREELVELSAWLLDLDDWVSGNPPPPPYEPAGRPS